ncbi:MAG: helix-turn-helix transcriptional regulator, partial [Lachnospiraceae bacterium]|nr:helix-turn-helix transcriptional regulator [Lachnospiraceae bacterium]
MDQKKTGEFLKELRTKKQMTQEQAAEKFNVSSRTVSRWETGRNMPDISLLTEIADFYDVDVREIIEGERKSEMMDKEIKDVADKMADYAHNEKGKLLRVIQVISIIGVVISFLSIILQTVGYNKPENLSVERTLALLASLAVLVIMSVTTLYVTGLLRKITNNKVLMTVIIVLTGMILTMSVIWIIGAYLVIGLFALL